MGHHLSTLPHLPRRFQLKIYTTVTMMKFCVLSLVVLALAAPALEARHHGHRRSVEDVLAAHPDEVAQAQAAAAASDAVAAHPDEIAQAQAALDGAHAKKKDAATAAADAHPEAVEKANAAAAQKQANHEQAAAAFVA